MPNIILGRVCIRLCFEGGVPSSLKVRHLAGRADEGLEVASVVDGLDELVAFGGEEVFGRSSHLRDM